LPVARILPRELLARDSGTTTTICANRRRWR